MYIRAYRTMLLVVLTVSCVAQTENIIDLGADPAGKEDSTAVIQSALDKGGTIIFPQGTYKVTRPLVASKSGTYIEAEYGAIIYIPAGVFLNRILLLGVASGEDDDLIYKVRDMRIDNLTIRNDINNYKITRNQGVGIQLRGVTNAVISNCRVENIIHSAIHVSACRNVRIADSTTIGARHGLDSNGNYKSGRFPNTNIQISNCHITESWDTGIVVGYFNHNCILSHNIIDRIGCHAIDIFHDDGVVVTGNIIKNWLDLTLHKEIAEKGYDPSKTAPKQTVGIFVHPDLRPEVPTRNISIIGNTIIHDPVPAGVHPICIEVIGVSIGVNITGNTLIGGHTALSIGQIWAYGDIRGYIKTIESVAGSKKKAPPSAPQNVLFANNTCMDQSGAWIYTDSLKPMSVMITANIFAPKDGATAVLGKQTKGLVFNDNTFRSGRFPEKLPKGITWGKNFVGADVVGVVPNSIRIVD